MISGIEHIGIRLRQSRMQKGLSQAKLGQLSSTNQGVIQKIENGASLHPTKIMEIAEVLDVNPAWLQFGEPWDRKNVRDRIPDPLIILTETESRPGALSANHHRATGPPTSTSPPGSN